MRNEKISVAPSATTSPNLEAKLLSNHQAECLALVIVWSAREPERVGEVALVTPDKPVWILGRSPVPSSQAEYERSASTPNKTRALMPDVQGRPLLFFRQRPPGVRDFESPDTASIHLGGESLSRRQLAIIPSPSGLTIQNIGQCELAVNGHTVRDTTVCAGDTLYFKNQLLLYCTYRPIELPPCKAYPVSRVASFGQPDQDGMVGESPVMWKLRERVAACARTSFHVLVVGDSGSGKELAAQALHHLSGRASKKLVADNIAAIPPSLAAALLFGNKKNFPNPGMEEHIGLLGAANGSSLFLDEIGDMPEEVQPMFLRVTERHGEYFRLGEESRLQRSDFRLIGATNRPEKMRYELKRRFAREIRVPGLNQRKEDIPLLIRHLLQSQANNDDMDAARFMSGSYPRVHPLLVEQLIHHTYKTHVSEIAFLLGQAMAESDHDIIRPIGTGQRLELTQLSERVSLPERRPSSPLPTLQEAQRVLQENHGHVRRTAQALNISRHQLRRLMQREGLTLAAASTSGTLRSSAAAISQLAMGRGAHMLTTPAPSQGLHSPPSSVASRFDDVEEPTEE